MIYRVREDALGLYGNPDLTGVFFGGLFERVGGGTPIMALNELAVKGAKPKERAYISAMKHFIPRYKTSKSSSSSLLNE